MTKKKFIEKWGDKIVKSLDNLNECDQIEVDFDLLIENELQLKLEEMNKTGKFIKCKKK